MRCKVYSYLPAQTRQLREQIFVQEQGFQQEFDEIDEHCQHLLAFADPSERAGMDAPDLPQNANTGERVESRGELQEPQAIATARFFASTPSGEPLAADQAEGAATYTVGRVAVDQAWRGQHIGTLVLATAEAAISQRGGQTVVLHAQEQAQDFYHKQGYQAFGERDFDEDCPHVWMRKELKSSSPHIQHMWPLGSRSGSAASQAEPNAENARKSEE
ncbi:hypothetical protein KIM372_14580 [Bombiscardovia nodaiensis]|uniref:N-acetyltransferase domain-containing protein n=1 Tax=Bombiscardovia nodaiensis TaxID=2932181 RepID=A0ABM8B9H5_9BIFI|nr:hypothetical protein KIM372_14580 [Bombiscardovia nodaiensis]